MTRTIDWGALPAPSLADLEAIAHETLFGLPLSLRELANGVVIQIDDFPTEEVMRELGAESEFDLLGLFTGVGLAQGAAVAPTGQMPNVIHLYRRPILDYWAEHEETLGAIVAHVMIHEIGHHFGLSDEDMEAIEEKAAAEA